MRLNRRYLYLFLLIIVNLVAVGQQDPQFSQNMFNHQMVNPGFAGSSDAISASLLHRLQWAGFPGAPVTTSFNLDATVKLIGKRDGVGITIINDEIGYDKNVTLGLIYSWRARVGSGDLGIGFSGGLLSKNMDLKLSGEGSELVDRTDIQIPEGEISQFVTDFGIGAFYEHNKYYIGASLKHLNQPSLQHTESGEYAIERHYYFTAGYNITLTNSLFEMKPSVFYKTDVTSSQLDVNVNLHYDKRLWGGISYRINDAIVVMLGTEMKNGLKIGYAYDVLTSAIAGYSSGSHEFYLGYSFNLTKKRAQKYKSVRYL